NCGIIETKMGTTTEDIEVRQFAAPPHAEWRPRHNPWAIALTVTMATFMEVLDTSIANVALPHIAGSLSASTDESTWVLTSYLVSNAVVLPISGWASDILARKRRYRTCVAMLGVSARHIGRATGGGRMRLSPRWADLRPPGFRAQSKPRSRAATR